MLIVFVGDLYSLVDVNKNSFAELLFQVDFRSSLQIFVLVYLLILTRLFSLSLMKIHTNISKEREKLMTWK